VGLGFKEKFEGPSVVVVVFGIRPALWLNLYKGVGLNGKLPQIDRGAAVGQLPSAAHVWRAGTAHLRFS